jgi:glycosyltransferase involved in cell wall biosynthesis
MNQPKQILVDARMHRHSGVGTFIQNLVPLLFARLPAYRWAAFLPDPSRPEWLPEEINIIPSSEPIYSVRELLYLPGKIPKNSQLFWCPHYNIPWKMNCPLITTVHDLNHLSRSPSLLQHPLRYLYPRVMFRRLAHQSKHIFCVSNFTKDEFLNFFPAAANKVTSVVNGVDPEWFVPPSLPPLKTKPYLLFVGTVRPHKNLKNLLLAYHRLPNPETLDLVVVGPYKNFLSEDPEALNLAKRLHSSVHLTGELPKEDLKNLMYHAEALIFPSFYEGFGLPVLEALAAGCLVACSDLPSLREIGAHLPLYFNPQSPDDILQKIEQLRHLPEDSKSAIKKQGVERARNFNWNKTAGVYAEQFKRLLENK